MASAICYLFYFVFGKEYKATFFSYYLLCWLFIMMVDVVDGVMGFGAYYLYSTLSFNFLGLIAATGLRGAANENPEPK
ncbi:MAG: hypothetical protein COT85_01515 [Chlamydiae bacterium CG10_big_fil_rev_8_21_14_0_10_42_34]|nr:MAG: hypothetical protein COT85_01515 [Chlamydiae bacterium CG10_big_fil_rev_8_21_14_0_10_42_34]